MTSLLNLPVIEISEVATIRLIPNADHKPSVLSRLVDEDRNRLATVEQYEGRTNKRLMAGHSVLPPLDTRKQTYGIPTRIGACDNSYITPKNKKASPREALLQNA